MMRSNTEEIECKLNLNRSMCKTLVKYEKWLRENAGDVRKLRKNAKGYEEMPGVARKCGYLREVAGSCRKNKSGKLTRKLRIF